MFNIFDGLVRWFWEVIYGFTQFLAWILGLLYDLYEVAIGLDTVKYEGSDKSTLLDVVFDNSMVTRAYWTLAAVGIALCFLFTIIAVIKKMFDSNDEVKTSLGQILTTSIKSIIIIVAMSIVMKVAIYFSTSMMTAIQLAFFSNTSTATQEDPKTYSKEEYATMANVLNTIGNYSLNSSYNSRYNINSCYNAIRSDLATLNSLGTFSVRYETPDVLNQKEHYWQEALQKIVAAAPSLTSDIPIDKYNSTLTAAIVDVMDELKNDSDFKPLEKYASSVVGANSGDINIDRIVLLVGTLNAANDSEYNGDNASLTDLVRAPYYYGDNGYSVYNASEMEKNFDLSDYSYVLVWFIIVVIAYNMAFILMSAIARIFNMAILYIVAPPFIAMSPMDGGAKFRQWRISFMVQCFSVFGTLVAMDVVITFIPIIMSGSLKIFDNGMANYMAKLVIIWGAFFATKKAGNLISGILAENASMTAADSLKMDEAGSGLLTAVGYATGAKAIGGAIGMVWGNAKDRMRENMLWGKKDGGSGSGGSGSSGNNNFVKTSAQSPDAGPGGKKGPGGNNAPEGNNAPGGNNQLNNPTKSTNSTNEKKEDDKKEDDKSSPSGKEGDNKIAENPPKLRGEGNTDKKDDTTKKDDTAGTGTGTTGTGTGTTGTGKIDNKSQDKKDDKDKKDDDKKDDDKKEESPLFASNLSQKKNDDDDEDELMGDMSNGYNNDDTQTDAEATDGNSDPKPEALDFGAAGRPRSASVGPRGYRGSGARGGKGGNAGKGGTGGQGGSSGGNSSNNSTSNLQNLNATAKEGDTTSAASNAGAQTDAAGGTGTGFQSNNVSGTAPAGGAGMQGGGNVGGSVGEGSAQTGTTGGTGTGFQNSNVGGAASTVGTGMQGTVTGGGNVGGSGSQTGTTGGTGTGFQNNGVSGTGTAPADSNIFNANAGTFTEADNFEQESTAAGVEEPAVGGDFSPAGGEGQVAGGDFNSVGDEGQGVGGNFSQAGGNNEGFVDTSADMNSNIHNEGMGSSYGRDEINPDTFVNDGQPVNDAGSSYDEPIISNEAFNDAAVNQNESIPNDSQPEVQMGFQQESQPEVQMGFQQDSQPEVQTGFQQEQTVEAQPANENNNSYVAGNDNIINNNNQPAGAVQMDNNMNVNMRPANTPPPLRNHNISDDKN